MSGPDERAEFREFVRRAHPDRGGDHDEFVAGLAELRDKADRRYDAPVVGGASSRGLRARLDRLRRRRARKRRVI